MKIFKKSLTVLLVLAMLFACPGTASAADTMTQKQWDKYWSDSKDLQPAVTMFPGNDETERYIAWYSETSEGYVELTTDKGTERFTAEAKKTPQGDYRLGAVISGLEEGAYTYKCVSGDYTSEAYKFNVRISDSFTALYVTDIHVAVDKEENVNTTSSTSFKHNAVLEAAYNTAKKNGGSLDLILSGGDQASGGKREELMGLSSPEYVRTIPFSVSIGNHDRKAADYKYYTYLPNEADNTFRSYIGTDYYFTQGDALFLIFDSNNSSMHGHYDFIKEALKANPDVKWRIAVMHHDLYGGREPALDTENALLRLLWTPIFDEFGIDLCLYGHSHYHTVSNVIYDNKTVESLVDKKEVTDAKGTIYMASGSINNDCDLTMEDGSEPPLGENVGHSYLTNEAIYNMLEFTENSLTIRSYTLESGKEFDSLTINKTTKDGGHQYKYTKGILKPLVFFVSRIVNVINNVDMYERYVEQGHDISLLEGLVGTNPFKK